MCYHLQLILATPVKVRVVNTLKIPATSELEILACIPHTTLVGGTWLIEGGKLSSVLVA